MLDFSNKTLIEILDILKPIVDAMSPQEIVEFLAHNPDLKSNFYSGKKITHNGIEFICRGYKSWLDLSHNFECRLLTPKIHSQNKIIIKLQKINTDKSFHNLISKEEKYGTKSIFANIYKNEETSFLFYYLNAIRDVEALLKINKKIRVLNLGVNSGDELDIVKYELNNFNNLEIVGVDYCSSAIDEARDKFKDDKNIKFYNYNIDNLSSLDIGKFDLIISIGTLQSSSLEFNPTFMNIVQNYLKKSGAMILGFPNCRWVDGEMIYGAKVKHYNFSEMSVVYKDIIFCKKYLQQKKFRVTITGKDYIFLTATSIRK